MTLQEPQDQDRVRSDRADTFFYLSLLIIGGSELVFHSFLPRWVTYGAIPVVLIYILVFVLIRRRRAARTLGTPGE